MLRILPPLCTLMLVCAPLAAAAAPRERAIEQIPELMGRILESQEEIREAEAEMKPIVERYDQKLVTAKQDVDNAASEQEAAEALAARDLGASDWSVLGVD